MNKHKLLKKVLGGSKNIRFGDMVTLIEAFGFQQMRVRGGRPRDYHRSRRHGLPESASEQRGCQRILRHRSRECS